jgi:hypothetical protein
MRSFVPICSLAVASYFLVACGGTNPPDTKPAVQAKQVLEMCQPLTREQLFLNNKPDRVDTAADYAVYAILSSRAYWDTANNKDFPLPPGWSEVKNARKMDDRSGFAATVFELNNPKLSEVAVAFRGTDQKRDWIQENLRPSSNQKSYAEEEIKSVMKAYADPTLRIVATGHSLGGGLAYYVSFTHPRVEAITFDSSPRIGVRTKSLNNNLRVGIYEHGEILGTVRKVASKWIGRRAWDSIAQKEFQFVDFDFSKRGTYPDAQHSIYSLANNLVQLSAKGTSEISAWRNKLCSN